MENRFVTIATLKKPDADILKKQFETENINFRTIEAKSVKINEPDGIGFQVKEKDRKKSIKILRNFSKTYGIETLDNDIFSKKIERILVPVDFSENSLNACYYALGLADKLESEVMLLHAYFFPVINSIDYAEGLSYIISASETVTEIAQKAKTDLLNLYNKLQDHVKSQNYKNVTLNFSLVNGNPSNEILNNYHEYHPDLIIIGTKGKSIREKEHFGSVVAATISNVNIPVLAVPRVAKYSGINHINLLYATNFDESDFKAIKKLMTLVYSFDIKINFVHIGEREKEKIQKLEELKQFFNNIYPGYELECHIIEDKNILEPLQTFIASKSIDIIAMTTHKRNFISRIFYPSMTKKMLFQSNTPLLVFHA